MPPAKICRFPRALALAAAASLALLAPAASRADGPSCVTAGGELRPAATSAPLRFGIYPGGPAGAVGASAPVVPENPVARLAAVRELAGGRAFVVHLYTGWSGDPGRDAATATWLDGEIRGYTGAGIQVELVARYEPRGLEAAAAVRGFADFTRGLVARYGDDPRFIALQVGNEANLAGAPSASDGSAPGAIQALVAGVLAAKDEVRRSGRGHVAIGINWAYDERPSATSDFWAALGRAGGPAFAHAIDWVGLDSYPGTWSPQLDLGGSLPSQAGPAVVDGIRVLRNCYLPMAGIGADVPLHISENGFPTGPGRSPALQAAALAAMVRAVDTVRATYNVSDYRWFDLRDANSSDASFESQYGLTDDRYVPKPAFATYRDLIAELGGGRRRGARSAVAGLSCRSSPLRLVVAAWQVRRIARLQVIVDGRRRRTVQRVNGPRVLRLSLAPGRHRLVIRQTVRRAGRTVASTRRVTVRICR